MRLIIGLFFALLSTAHAAPTRKIAINAGEVIKLSKPASEIFIANPQILDVQLTKPKQVYLFAKKVGTTNVTILNEKGDTILAEDVQVTFDLVQLKRAVEDIAGPGCVEITPFPNGIILKGTVQDSTILSNVVNLATSYLGKDAHVINALKVAAPSQVNLRVKVIQITRSVTNTLGINWDNAFGDGKFTIGTFTGTKFLTSGATGLRPFNTTNMAGSSYATTATAMRFLNNNHIDLNLLVSALESEGLLSVLAEPNLTTISGQAANFLSGGELGIPIPSDPPSIMYKSYGVSLSFTPTVLTSNRINIKVKPEVSTPDYNNSFKLDANTNVPNIVTRRAETTVELASGQSFVIAGLIENDINTRIQGTPGLADIPLLGNLFRSNDYSRADTEIIIIVTPYIVQPIKSRDVLTPLDGIELTTATEKTVNHELTKAHDTTANVTNDKNTAGFQLEDEDTAYEMAQETLAKAA